MDVIAGHCVITAAERETVRSHVMVKRERLAEMTSPVSLKLTSNNLQYFLAGYRRDLQVFHVFVRKPGIQRAHVLQPAAGNSEDRSVRFHRNLVLNARAARPRECARFLGRALGFRLRTQRTRRWPYRRSS